MSGKQNFVPRNASIKDQLSRLIPKSDRNTGGRTFSNSNRQGRYDKPMSAPQGADGVNHINIFEGAVTDLGKCLSHSSQLRFHHKLYGAFSNIEAFWYYIRSEEHDDRVRKLTGSQLKSFADRMTSRRVKNFMAIILDANWQRINQYPELKAAVKENQLPFECYSYLKRNDGLRQRPPHAHWMIPLFTEISNALKEEREPNLTDFLDDPKIGLYDDVFPKKETDDPILTNAVSDQDVPTNVIHNPSLGALLNRPVEAEVAPVTETPVAAEAEQAPVATEAEQAPVATEAEQAPVATEAEQAPAVAEAEPAPVAEVAEVQLEVTEYPVVNDTCHAEMIVEETEGDIDAGINETTEGQKPQLSPVDDVCKTLDAANHF